ncbi:MAG: hypothetical protein ING08_03035 [Roseomonas sp.]|nr:hypothetical protein [Roseomonas sp.]MCA3379195.1 hypothetical protein [Roseomonas sp.]
MSGEAATSPNYAVDPAYSRTPPILLLERITALQEDGLLLLDHLAKRPARRFATNSPPKSQDQTLVVDPATAEPGNGSDLNLSIEPLQLSAAQVAENTEKFRELVCLIDELARLAYPATPRTIRTSRRGGSITDFILPLLMLGALLLGVLGLWKADEGRKLVADARTIQALAQPTFASLALLETQKNFHQMHCNEAQQPPNCSLTPAEHSHQSHFFCEIENSESGNKSPYYLQAKTPEAERLCGVLREQRLRERMIFARLRGWNCEMAEIPIFGDTLLRFFSKWNDKTLDPRNPRTAFTHCDVFDYNPNEKLVNQTERDRRQYLVHWQRSELRAIPVLHLLSQHLLPAVLAMLGASISLMLSRYRARNMETLRDGIFSSLALIIMPTTMGALLGLVWGTNIDPVTIHQIKIGDFSFNLGVIAFFMGFVFQDVLDWLRQKIRKLLDEDTKEQKANLRA